MIFCPISASVTGQTPGYSPMVSNDVDFPVNMDADVVQAYCLDAPVYIPTGVTRHVGTYNGVRYGQALFTRRDGV